MELARTQEDKDLLSFFVNSGVVGRGIFAPPGLMGERLRVLRSAFDETMKDLDYVTEMTNARLDFEPISGAELQTLIEAATKVSGEVLVRARTLRGD